MNKEETHATIIMHTCIDGLVLFGLCYLDAKNNTWSYRHFNLSAWPCGCSLGCQWSHISFLEI